MIILIGVLIRIFLTFSFLGYHHYDSESFKLVGSITLKGNSIYPSVAYFHHPYLPFLLYIESFSMFLSQFNVDPMLTMKLFFNIFDVLNIFLLYKLTRNKFPAFLYSINPAIIFYTSAHGQIDTVPIFFILLSIFYLKRKRSLISSVMLSLGVLVKTWPLFLLFIFVKYSRQWYYYIFSLLIPCAFVFVYADLFHTSILSILYPAISYRGGYGAWGISIFLAQVLPSTPGFFSGLIKVITNAEIFIILGIFFFRRKGEIIKEIYLFLLVFSIFSLSGNNPIWLLPFILILKPYLWKTWIMLLSIYTGVNMFHEIIHPLSLSLEKIAFNTALFFAFLIWLAEIGMLFNIKSFQGNK